MSDIEDGDSDDSVVFVGKKPILFKIIVFLIHKKMSQKRRKIVKDLDQPDTITETTDNYTNKYMNKSKQIHI